MLTLNARAEVLNWLAAQDTGQQAMSQAEAAGPTFAELAAQWLDGVHSGVIARRRGPKGVAYSPTTFAGYERSLRYVLLPEFGSWPASTIDDAEWQSWVDRLSREGLSRSRIADHPVVARAIYGWASRPTRRLAARNAQRRSPARRAKQGGRGFRIVGAKPSPASPGAPMLVARCLRPLAEAATAEGDRSSDPDARGSACAWRK